jgi:hypothetical protein
MVLCLSEVIRLETVPAVEALASVERNGINDRLRRPKK